MDESAGIRVGEGAHVDELHVHGDVAGRDIVHITAELTYDVSELSANPYVGLASFTYETRAFYGGREQQVAEAVRLITEDEPRLIFVTGASGSGKSSFVQAGVLPALEAQVGGLAWQVVRPGRHPLAAIEGAIAALQTKARAKSKRVLVVDQFEELFTQAEAGERGRVLEWLSQQDSVQVVATLRSDYLPTIFNDAALLKAFKESGIELRAMNATELARAIRQPLLEQARRDGKTKAIQPALVERLTEDVGSDSTLLPLLQVTLTRLWDEPPHTLTLERYRTLTDALEQQAERAYAYTPSGRARADDERQELMSILLDLVEVSLDDDASRDVRRTVPKAVLIGHKPERQRLIDELVEARLLTASGEQVDIIHETLLRNWPRLSTAVLAERDRLQSAEKFRIALQEWLEHERADDYLLEGVRLAQARLLASRGDIALSGDAARELLERSQQRQEEEQQRELAQARALAAEQQARAQEQQARATESQRAARTLRKWLIATALAGLLALVAAGVAIRAFVQADEQARINASRELGARALVTLDTDADLAILLAREGVRTSNTREADEALRTALAKSPARLVLRQPNAGITAAAYSPDGGTVLTGASDGSVRLWDARTGATKSEIAAGAGAIRAVGFLGSGDSYYAVTGERTRVWVGNGQAREGPGGAVAAASGDGRWLAVAAADGTLSVIDGRTGVPTTRQSARVSALAVRSDGAVATGGVDGGVRVLSAAGEEVVLGPGGPPIVGLAFDAQGNLRALDQAGNVRSGGSETSALRGHVAAIAKAAFSTDGRLIITGGLDHTARVWDSETSTTLLELRGHEREVTTAEISSDGTRALTVSVDGAARVWDLSAGRDFTELRGHRGRVVSVAFDAQGQVASGGFDNTVRLWTLHGRPQAAPRELQSAVTSVAYSPDGERLAIGQRNGQVLITDLGIRRAPDVSIAAHQGTLYTVAFSPNGEQVVSASGDGTARVWNSRTGERQGELKHPGEVINAVFSPDGQRIATAGGDGVVRIWNGGAVERELKGHNGRVYRVSYTPDGKQVISGGEDGTLRVWDAATGNELRKLPGHVGAVYSVDISQDGRLLLSGGADRSVLVWDMTTWQRIAELRGATDEVQYATFSRDGQRVAVASADGLVRVYRREQFAPQMEVLDLVPQRVMRQPAELSSEERTRFVNSTRT